MSSFDRGFKTWAERTAVSLRKDLGLESTAPLSPQNLASYLEVNLWTPNDVVGLPKECLAQLLEIDSAGWSAVTLSSGEKDTVIYNPSHSAARISNDIMHELSHLVVGHEPSRIVVSADGDVVLRSYDQKQEDEASWLGACLLLPREALLHIKLGSLSSDKACSLYSVSPQLLGYRINVTGVNYQVGRLKRK